MLLLRVIFNYNLLKGITNTIFPPVEVSPLVAFCRQVRKDPSITDAHASPSELQPLSNSLESDRESAIAF